MKLTKLTRILLAQHPTADGQTEASLLRTLQGSSQFKVQDTRISLASW